MYKNNTGLNGKPKSENQILTKKQPSIKKHKKKINYVLLDSLVFFIIAISFATASYFSHPTSKEPEHALFIIREMFSYIFLILAAFFALCSAVSFVISFSSKKAKPHIKLLLTKKAK